MGSWRISAGDEQGSVAGILLLPYFDEFAAGPCSSPADIRQGPIGDCIIRGMRMHFPPFCMPEKATVNLFIETVKMRQLAIINFTAFIDTPKYWQSSFSYQTHSASLSFSRTSIVC